MLIEPTWRRRLLSPASEERLAAAAEVVSPAGRLRADDVPGLMHGAVACLTGWGTPPLTDDLLDGAARLQLVAHTAGTVRALLPPSIWRRGVRVSQATAMMAPAVAEHMVAQALACLQGLPRHDAQMRRGEDWPAPVELNRLLLGARTVGIWGLGRVGIAAAQLFRAFGCDVLGCDPTVDDARAAALGVTAVSLEELFERADVVCLVAPVVPETRGRVDAAMLARLRDGAVLVSTGRAALVVEDAFLAEAASGRITVAVDVYHQEPLPRDSPLRRLPNVVLSPHVAGHTVDTQFAQGGAMVEEILRYLGGQDLRYELTRTQAAVSA